MPELSPARDACHYARATDRVAELAERQWGVVSHAQLVEAGLNRTRIRSWVHQRRLFPVHAGVYAVGHPVLGIEGKLASALFYAGPGSALCGVTAGWWWGMLHTEPRRLHVVARGKRQSLPHVRGRRCRRLERIWHKRFPVTPPARTLLDIADVVRVTQLRRALAEAEYLKLVTLDEVEEELGRGRSGGASLRGALECHRPELAHTRSRMEEVFCLLCERCFLTQPQLNVSVAGWLVDAVWFEQKVVVELDSRLAHSTGRAIENDYRRDLDLRAAGFIVLRYTWRQLVEEPERVVADLRRHGIT